MATTRLMPLHTGKGRTVGQAISDIIDYTENPQKTDGGRLITSWQCDSRIADAEFLFTKNQYIQKTGRVRGEDNVIAYHLRQSFVPGEITPEDANRLGCELAKRFTKGNHAYIVCTHIDKAHIHNHVIWNSTALSQTRKFRNFWGSSRAVRRLNDTICIENGCSIVENPKRHGKSYNKWLGDKKKPSHRERICTAIDDALTQKPDSFEALLELLRQAGYEVKGKKVPSLLGGEQKKSIRMDTLGDGYTPADLRAVIAGEKTHTPRKRRTEITVPEKKSGNLLVDIQAKLRAGKGAGYARWATLFNLKQIAGLNTIAVRLNEAGVLTPSHYKKMQGKITHKNLLGSGKWQTRTVGVILRSEVYTGDLVQGQTKTVDHRQVKADAEEWTVVRDTHEAIISREQFAAVQAILDQTASRAKAREVKAYTPNLLKGKVFCAHCGGSLHRQRNIRKKFDDVYFYHCLSQSRISKDTCPGVAIREDALLDMLADMLQEALNTALGDYRLSLAELPRQAADRAELREKITSRKQEIQRLRGIVRGLYENLVQGVLTKDEYFDYKEKYESRIADLAVEMEQLEDGLRTMDAQTEQHRALEQDAAQIKTDRGLTGALIERLIDRIEVSHDKQITVRYRFQSEFETYAEVLEQCRNM